MAVVTTTNVMAMKTHQLRLSACSTNELNANPIIVAVTIQTSENLRTPRPRLLMYSLIVMTTHPIVWGQSMRPHDAGGRPMCPSSGHDPLRYVASGRFRAENDYLE